ncbi:MAG: thioredoxin-like domain-containing protein, partial [Fimbriimonadales bacterium]
VYLPSDVRPPLGLLINRPDWLWGYLATIDAQSLAQGRLTLDLPSSGALVVRVNASQYPQLDSTRCRLSIIHTHPEISTPLILYSLPIDAPTKEVRLENLAPSSQWEIELWLFSRENYYREQRRVRILPQETRTVTLRYTPYDPNRYKGNRRVVLRMLRRDGTPASNVPLQVRLYLPQYAQSIQVARGSTDAQGRLELKNLYELSAPAETRQEPYYIVSKLGDWQSIAEFTLTRDDGQQEILIVEPVRVGDSVSDVEFTDLRTGATCCLAEFQGQFVLLDFWATWCQPCHRALEELHREWQNLTPEQRERIKVVLVSIDDTRTGVLEFLKQRGWDTIGEPLWVPGWSAPAAMAFTVSSIPRQIIIDPQGRVAVLEAREPLATILNMLEDNSSTGKLEPSPN